MFKNALAYRITQWQQPTLADLEERLAAARFAACGATQMEAMGCVEPRGEKHGALLESVEAESHSSETVGTVRAVAAD